MAALYGRLQGNRGEATRVGTEASGIRSTLETWQGKVVTSLDADGNFTVAVGEKHGVSQVIFEGNVNVTEFPR